MRPRTVLSLGLFLALSACTPSGCAPPSAILTPVDESFCRFPANTQNVSIVAGDGMNGTYWLYTLAAANNWNGAATDAPRLVYSGESASYSISAGYRWDPDSRWSGAARDSCVLGLQIHIFTLNGYYLPSGNAAIETAAHEMGHLFGLGHHPFRLGLDVPLTPSDCPNVALMYWTADAGEVCGITAPTSFDIPTINVLYD